METSARAPTRRRILRRSTRRLDGGRRAPTPSSSRRPWRTRSSGRCGDARGAAPRPLPAARRVHPVARGGALWIPPESGLAVAGASGDERTTAAGVAASAGRGLRCLHAVCDRGERRAPGWSPRTRARSGPARGLARTHRRASGALKMRRATVRRARPQRRHVPPRRARRARVVAGGAAPRGPRLTRPHDRSAGATTRRVARRARRRRAT